MLINLRNALMTGRRLPYDAEVEYLESTGTQWIDTGVVPTATTGMRVAFTPLQIGGTTVTCGSRNSGTNTRFWVNPSTQIVAFGFGRVYDNTNVTSTVGKYYEATLNFNNDGKGTCDGRTINVSNFTGNSYSIYVFGANVGGTATFLSTSTAKIYALQITQGATLVRDFIPVRKGTTGYLYDRVSGKMKPFGNMGTGDFVLGPDVVPVEWLESDGNQYIDTGVKPDATYTFDSTVAVMQSNYNCTYWGCRSSGSYLSINNQCYLASNTMGSSHNIYHYIRLISTNAENDSNWNSGIIPETGRMYDFSGITTVSTMNAMTYPVVLFGLNIYGTINSSSGKVRIAKWTPYKSGVRVNDFRPVRVGTDATSWEGAMMDVLTRRIYRNAGTGAFTYGNDLKYPIPAE